jgi:hypothetical protein
VAGVGALRFRAVAPISRRFGVGEFRAIESQGKAGYGDR